MTLKQNVFLIISRTCIVSCHHIMSGLSSITGIAAFYLYHVVFAMTFSEEVTDHCYVTTLIELLSPPLLQPQQQTQAQ